MITPLLIKNEPVRIKTEVSFANRPIGVLNFKSFDANGFTQGDIDTLLPLVSQASLLIEKFAIETKLVELRAIEKSISLKQDWKEVLERIGEGIQRTLGFEVKFLFGKRD